MQEPYMDLITLRRPLAINATTKVEKKRTYIYSDCTKFVLASLFLFLFSPKQVFFSTKCSFAYLARMVFMLRQRMKDLLPRVRVIVRSSKMKILTPFVVQITSKYCKQKRAARAARLFFSHAANQIIDLWHCRCC